MVKRIILISLALFLIVQAISFAEEPGTIKWKIPLDSASCYSPAIGHDGTLYVPSGNRLLAINPDGTPKWSFLAGTYSVNTPSVDSNGNIYFQSRPDGVYALDSNGIFLWNYNPTGIWIGDDAGGHIAIGQNIIYATQSGYPLHAIEKSTGTGKWISTISGATPAISGDGNIYSTGPSSAPHYLFELNKTDGSVLMQSSVPIPSYSWSPTIGNNGQIYLSGAYNFRSFNADGFLEWNYWHSTKGMYAVNSADGTIYFSCQGNNAGFLRALNPDGSEKWTYDLSQVWPSGSPIVGNDNNIYFAAHDGFMALSPERVLIWKINYSDPDGFYVHVWGSPVMGSDGTIYVIGTARSDNKAYLYAINTSSTGPAASSWPMMGANAQHTHVAGVSSVPNQALPDTGQTTCYDGQGNVITCPMPGESLAQDGSYNINPLSYTDNGDGTVTDNNTGLIWQKEDDGNTYNWYEASGAYDATHNPESQNVCADLGAGWRLPKVKELMSIVD